MKKIMNDPADFVDQVIDGFLAAHGGDIVPVGEDRRVLARIEAPVPGKVGLVTGGGSGHLPLFLGYVGEGLMDAVAIGNVFSAQSADAALDATLAADSGAGVLHLYANYSGDRLNFELAADLAEEQGIRTLSVRVSDDVGSAPKSARRSRRGVAGTVLVYKCAGASASRGDDLDTVRRIAQKAADNVATMGVGLSPSILPTVGRPTFELPDGEMEIGIGIHGEKGRQRGPIRSASQIAAELTDSVCEDLELQSGETVVVLVNGLGATPLEELFVLHRSVHEELRGRGLEIHRVLLGEYSTSLEMAGASVSVLRLDDELLPLFDAVAKSPLVRF
jgi:dihydroxyacetone kinase-like protein